MKYPAGLSGEEYAAMEEGYEQGREAGREEMRVELEKAGWVSPEEYVGGIAGAVAGTMDRIRAEVIAEFVERVATQHAYNGAPDPGQQFYDWGLNPWLAQIAAQERE